MEKLNGLEEKKAMQLRNVVIMIGFILINTILAAAYYLEVVKGNRGLSSYFIILAGCIIPTILMIITYFKNKSSLLVRYMGTIGFCILYTYILLTASTHLPFCYILLIFTLLTMFADFKLSCACSIYAILVNILRAIVLGRAGKLDAADITEIEIVIVCTFLAAIFSLLTTYITVKINKANMERTRQEKEQMQLLLNKILEASDLIVKSVDNASIEMASLDASIISTKESMKDVAAGANETVNAIQLQQIKTEEINHNIGIVSEVTRKIGEDVKETESILEVSQTDMRSLMDQVESCEESGKQVVEEMSALQSHTDKMQEIMSIINSVASQTGLLALNASIEAARAGESGRGFAVVANEISNLANQTSVATKEIDNIIGSIVKSVTEVVGTTQELISSNKLQNEYIESTAEHIQAIYESSHTIFGQANELKEVVETVLSANEEIVESVQNVSAITEEVTARATETLESSSNDSITVSRVVEIVQQLSFEANELKEVTNS